MKSQPKAVGTPPGAPKKDAEQPFCLADRLALRPKEAAQALGLSERTLRKLLPELPHVRTDGAVLIPVDQLRRWLEDRTKRGEALAASVAQEILAGDDDE